MALVDICCRALSLGVASANNFFNVARLSRRGGRINSYPFSGYGLENQILIFGVLSAVVIVLNRIYLQRRPIETDRPQLNRRGEQYVGRTFTLDSPISNGRGRVRVDDTTWRVQGKDAVAGAKIIVTGVDGASLVVEVTSD